jgi:hypothetical protein
MVMLKYYILVILFYIFEVILFYITSEYFVNHIIYSNIVIRITLAFMAGVTYFLFIFDREIFFILKYTLALIIYPFYSYFIFDYIINNYSVDIIAIKIFLDVIYSFFWYVIFRLKVFPKKLNTTDDK